MADDWKKKLTPEQYRVTREKGTERPFTSELLNFDKDGKYMCVCCGTELFDHCGWPAFYAGAKGEQNIARHEDRSHGMVRVEVTCKKCGAHLGHVFDDGPVEHGGERNESNRKYLYEFSGG